MAIDDTNTSDKQSAKTSPTPSFTSTKTFKYGRSIVKYIVGLQQEKKRQEEKKALKKSLAEKEVQGCWLEPKDAKWVADKKRGYNDAVREALFTFPTEEEEERLKAAMLGKKKMKEIGQPEEGDKQ